MKASIKLNPVRLVVPKYNNAPLLFLELLASMRIMPTKVINNNDSFEIVIPVTKHGIRPYKQYINDNLDINE